MLPMKSICEKINGAEVWFKQILAYKALWQEGGEHGKIVFLSIRRVFLNSYKARTPVSQ